MRKKNSPLQDKFNNMNITILASWSLVKSRGGIFIPTTHYLYLKYISSMYDNVYVISPLSIVKKNETNNYGELLNISNVHVVQLPNIVSYIDAIKKIRSYYSALKQVVDKVDVVYCRVPDPFSWMPTLIFKKKCIMHFVGDTIDATRHNEKWSWIKKKLMITGYLPEYWLTLMAARRNRVYTNGPHLVKKLAKHRVNATPVISSTVFKKDLCNNFKPLPISQGRIIITYIGYIRYAKGLNCLMDFCKLLCEANVSYRFHIIGDGEMFEDVKSFIENKSLTDYVTLHGHIDNKEETNRILRNSDLFFFPSLSEGSPRVVIEAMAQGTPVLSTPVGSLPGTFKDKETIRFFDFNDSKKALSIVKEYIQNPKPFETQRDLAFQMVAECFTIEKFLSKVFTYEE